MQHAGVAAGADDAAVGRHRVVHAEHALDLGLQFVFAHAGAAARIAASCAATLMSAARCISLSSSRRLEQAQLVEQVAEFEEFVRRLRAHAHLRAHAVEPADQLEVELGIAAEVVVHARAAFEQAGQDLVEVGDRIGVVHAEALDRAFRAAARTVPAFALGIAFAAEQDRFAVLAARAPAPAPLRAPGSR